MLRSTPNQPASCAQRFVTSVAQGFNQARAPRRPPRAARGEGPVLLFVLPAGHSARPLGKMSPGIGAAQEKLLE